MIVVIDAIEAIGAIGTIGTIDTIDTIDTIGTIGLFGEPLLDAVHGLETVIAVAKGRETDEALS